MKLTPASRAFAMIRAEVASSVAPPNIIAPRQTARPSGRCGRGGDIPSGVLTRNSVLVSVGVMRGAFGEAIRRFRLGHMDCFADLSRGRA